MNNLIHTLLGEGTKLDALQMGCRALSMFFITLLLIRISGMRAFGQKSAFDSIIVIMLGAILSRAVVGVSPFVPTVIASSVLAIVHRLIAIAAVYSDKIGRLVKGEKNILYKENQVIKKNMLLCSVSMKDMLEEIRLRTNQETLENILQVTMERSGKISVIKETHQ